MTKLLAGDPTQDSGGLVIETTPGQGFEIKSPLRGEITDISSLINIILSFLFPLAAIVLFAMLVYAGFTLMTAAGDEQKYTKGKGILTSSIIGFFLLVVAFFLVRIITYIFGLEGGIIGQ